MDPFWGITLSLIAIRWFWKSENRKYKDRKADEKRQERIVVKPVKTEEEKQREKEVQELRKQGYTDELIAVILPTINNGQ